MPKRPLLARMRKMTKIAHHNNSSGNTQFIIVASKLRHHPAGSLV